MFEKEYARNCEIKMILGTSDAWSMSPPLSRRPSDPDYNIED